MPPALPIPALGQSALLDVSHLAVAYKAADRRVPALRDVSFQVRAGEILGVLGESGSGKSTLALTLLRLLPSHTEVSGEIHLQDSDLLHLPEAELRLIRGATISLIHQEPGLSFSPVMRVGDQITELLRAHCPLERKAWPEKVLNMLTKVHLDDPKRVLRAYPHELSGGELHRAAIAQALVCQPNLVIADEPNRSLDVQLQLELLDLLRELNRELSTTFLFITHNPMLLAGFADRVLIMFSGEIVEQGRVADVFRQPGHAYTRRLLQCVPHASSGGREMPTRPQRELIPT